MLKAFYFAAIFAFLSFSSAYASSGSTTDFDERTLQELAEHSGHIFREFGKNNLKQPETKVFMEQQIIHKHGRDMYTLWQHANNWANAGKGELKSIRNNLQSSITFGAKNIIVGKLKNKSFVYVNLSPKKLKQSMLLTVQKGRIKIERDHTGREYDLIFQYKFSSDVGLTQQKEYGDRSEDPVLSRSRGARVLVVVIGMVDFLDEIYALTEHSGMTTENEVMELITHHPGRIKSVYVLPDYTF
tara:strand:+ start:1165 stop:1893 length:729 start_codon:yes stop_codon:yes gene_type:complete